MLLMKQNGVFIPLDEAIEDTYVCPWCGKNPCKCKSRTKYNGVILDRSHFINLENVERIFMISGYSFKKFNRVNTYYVDFMFNVNNKYKCTIKLLDKDVPYKTIATETFALSMAKNYVSYILNGDKFEGKLHDSNICRFIFKHYGYVTILCNDKLYNVYPDNEIIEIKIPKFNFTIAKCTNGTYYKVGKICDRHVP